MADSHYDVEQTNTNVEADTVLPDFDAPLAEDSTAKDVETAPVAAVEVESAPITQEEETMQEAHRGSSSRRAFSLFGNTDPDIQRAQVSKRLYAGLMDFILMALVAVAVILAMSAILHLEQYSRRYTAIVEQYEADYGVTFGLTVAEYNDLTEEEQANYKAAVDAVNADEALKKLMRKGAILMFVSVIVGILVAILLLEFVVPLLFKDGRTLGKKVFGLAVMRNNMTHIKPFVLFARSFVGKGVMELALPVSALISVILGLTGWFGIALLIVFVVMEIVVFARSRGSALLHDTLADTVVVDWASQRMFDTQEEARAFYEARRAEQEQNQPY